MPGIRDDGSWKKIEGIYVKDSSLWKEVIEVHQKHNGSWRLIWTPSEAFIVSGTNEEIKLRDGSYIVSGNQDITLTAVANFEAEVLMWGEGAGAEGGYTKGIVQFKEGFKYRIITGAGGGLASTSGTIGSRGGGYAGLFEGSTSSVSATHTQALLIAGGAGGRGEGSQIGGDGGGSSGGDGSGTGFGTGATQTSGPGGILKGEDATGSAGGEASYTTPGTYTWTCPAGVTSVSVVCIGGGASGAGGLNAPNRAQGGAGGGLIYGNNIPVTPGVNYSILAGFGGQAPTTAPGYGGQSHDFRAGQVSYFRQDSSNYIQAGNGQTREYSGVNARVGFTGASVTSYTGGDGGFGLINDNGTGYGGGGAGAGNYNGNGSNGSGLYSGYGTGPGTGVYGSNSGNYGAGGNGSSYTWNPGSSGQGGAVRIIWGTNTSFPNNAQEVPPGLSGGGAGYYGGGASRRISFPSGGGGGGSGYINASKVLAPRLTSTFDNASDSDRGDAGNVDYGPARVVIRLP